MAHELHLKFSDPAWYVDHIAEVRSAIERLPSFARAKSLRELWLKAKSSSGAWDYDLRIFLEPQGVLVEVTTFGTAYFADLQSLIGVLSSAVEVELVDDDGERVNIDEAIAGSTREVKD